MGNDDAEFKQTARADLDAAGDDAPDDVVEAVDTDEDASEAED